MGDKELAARVEERVIALDDKCDLYFHQNDSRHKEVTDMITTLSGDVRQALERARHCEELEKKLETHEKVLKTHNEKFVIAKRDKWWMMGILGVFWAAVLAWLRLSG